MFAAKNELFTRPSGGYQISRSLRFRSSASAYLSRTPSSAGNRKTWTWSGWVKKTDVASRSGLFSVGSSGGSPTYTETVLQFESDNRLLFFSESYTSSWVYECNFITSIVYRDPSAWMHVMVAVDTTQATSTNRVKIYINGVQIPASGFGTATYPALNADLWVNTTRQHVIGTNWNSGVIPSAEMMDGYLAEVNFIDGQALDPTSFGAYDTTTGVWGPKKYTGTYGTNGFYLNFSDNSGATSTTIGKDSSGNSNNWTPTNIVVTSGTTCDSMIDTPTPYADGGNGRGNYPVFNPLNNAGSATISDGNLKASSGAASPGVSVLSSFPIPSTGKYYAEFVCGATTTSTTAITFGVGTAASSRSAAYGTNAWVYYCDSGRLISRSGTSGSVSGGAFQSGDVLQVAIDRDNNQGWLGLNDVWIDASNGTTGNPSTGSSPTISSLPADLFIYAGFIGTNGNINFGQRPFSYTPPSGYSALNTQNLPTPTIKNGAQYMAAVTYTGNGTTKNVATTSSNSGNNPLGTTFQPDLVWIKDRTSAYDHRLFDAVRGVNKAIFSSATNAETNTTVNDNFTSFNTDGFSLGATSSTNGSNANNDSFIAWQWKGGNGTSSIAVNAYGSTPSIASTVSANTSAGFSVVTYTGTGANATVGHGLGPATPSMIIVKSRSVTTGWNVYHSNANASPASGVLYLNLTDAFYANNAWNATLPTSSVFYLGGTGLGVNNSSATYVAYCFAPVAGYSAFGSYTGNNSADGPFVYLGFRPRFLMIKDATSAGAWWIGDSSRATNNVVAASLFPNTSGAESSTYDQCDLLSNGFKWRANSANSWPNNVSGNTYIYAAFAETPFKFSRSR